MKSKSKIIKIAVLLVLSLIAASFFAMTAFADEDEGYYIEKADIRMEVSSDKSVQITEKLTVYFNESSHGIIRTIPTESLLEYYTITDADVIGHKYTYNNGVFKIGSENQTVSGRQTYIICYTINLYADASTEYDFFYPNVIGSENDTEIRSFTGTIVFPEDADIVDYNVTSGEYGSTDNEYASVRRNGNEIVLRSKKTLPAYNAVSIEVTLEEGAFEDAPVIEPDAVVDNLDITVTSDEYGVLSVTEEYDITVKSEGGNFARILTDKLNTSEGIGEWYVTDLEASCDKYPNSISVGSADIEDSKYAKIRLSGKKDETINFKINYKVVTNTIDEEPECPIGINFVYSGGTCVARIDNINLKLDTQALSNASMNSELREKFGLKPSFDAKGLSEDGARFTLDDPLAAGESFVLILKYKDEAFARKGRVFDWLIPLASAAILAVTLICVSRKKQKQLVPTIEYYPPYGLNPAEVGRIIDDTLSNKDVSSLIFYWASHGHIKIELTSANAFNLHLVSQLDDDHRVYEKNLFNGLWLHGANGVVSSSQLEQKFYVSIERAAAAIRKIYSGNQAVLDKKSINTANLLGTLAGIIPGALLLVASIIYKFSITGKLFGSIFFIGLVVAGVIMAVINARQQHIGGKGHKWKRVISVVLVIVGAVLSLAAVGGNFPAVSWFITAAASVAAALVSPKIVKRTDMGTDLLGKCIGFKQFLETAEKDRLEMLLEQNPDYYYNILPYAQVLGVSKIWEDKFKDLVTQPPTWCIGGYNYGNVYMTHVLLRSMNSVSRSVTSVPSNNTSGGRGGFGGGFGGGGFSGGGFGGGGVSRW